MADQAVASSEQDRRRWLPIAALAGFAAPGMLLVGSLLHAHLDVAVLSATTIVLFVLMVVRVAWLFERVNAQHDAVFEASREGGPVLDPKTLLPVENPPVPRAAIPPFVSHSQAIEELRAKREACPHAVNHQQYIREGQVCACEQGYSEEVIAAARS